MWCKATRVGHCEARAGISQIHGDRRSVSARTMERCALRPRAPLAGGHFLSAGRLRFRLKPEGHNAAGRQCNTLCGGNQKMKAMKRMLTWSLALCLILGASWPAAARPGRRRPEATETPEPVQEEAEEPAGAAEAETEEPVQEEQTLTVYVTISDAGGAESCPGACGGHRRRRRRRADRP